MQAPQRASLEYTSIAIRQVEQVVSKIQDIVGAFSVIGFSFTGNGPNKGIILINLKDSKDRKGVDHSAADIVDSLRAPLSQVSDVQVFPFLPPAINGIGNFGGFTFEVLDEGEGGHSLRELYDTTQEMVRTEKNDTT